MTCVERVARPTGASIRPRPGGRGDPATIRRGCSCRVARASIRPRPGGRGDTRCRLHDLIGRPGRSFNSATTRRPWRPDYEVDADRPCRTGRLQFGHDPEAVETSVRPARCRTARSGFNSATTRRPWRPAREAANGKRQGVLQFGHDPEAVETRRPWRPPAHVDESFNSATTRRPWRPSQSLDSCRAILRELQFGHDPEAVETFTVARRRSPHRLQFGHDPEAVETEQHATRRRGQELQFGHDPEAVETRGPDYRQKQSTPLASIRPRPGGRGDGLNGRSHWTSHAALQFGHDPEAVETANRRQSTPEPVALQFGHDPEAVETRSGMFATRRHARASIRPRPGGRGDRHRAERHRQRKETASIRPRPGGRGDR